MRKSTVTMLIQQYIDSVGSASTKFPNSAFGPARYSEECSVRGRGVGIETKLPGPCGNGIFQPILVQPFISILHMFPNMFECLNMKGA